jgi:hypothetical protein
MFSCAVICGILLFFLYAMKSYGSIIAFAVLYGFFSGGLISLQPACVAQITPDTRIIGLKIGLMMVICALGYVDPCLIALLFIFFGIFSNRILLMMAC